MRLFNLKPNVGCVFFLRELFKSPYSRLQIRCFKEGPIPNSKVKFNPFRTKFRSKKGNDPKTITRMLITILGNGAIGQPRCVALFTDYKG